MSNPRIPKDEKIPHRVAGWVAHEKPWAASDCCEWTYKRGEDGDITVFARTKQEALDTIEAHGFKDVNPDLLNQTGGYLTDYLKKAKESK